jgi:hypothetical protein
MNLIKNLSLIAAVLVLVASYVGIWLLHLPFKYFFELLDTVLTAIKETLELLPTVDNWW